MSLYQWLRRRPVVIAVAFTVLLATLIAGGIWLFRLEAARGRQVARDQLTTIADFKVSQLADWRRERLDDATGVARNPLFVQAVRGLLAAAPGRMAEVRAALEPQIRREKYAGFILLDVSGRAVLSLGTPSNVAPDADGHVAEVVSRRTAVFAHVHDADSLPYLDLYAPVALPGSDAGVEAVLVMRIDPRDFLVPLVQLWPVPSQTSETLIVTAGDDRVVFLVRPHRLPANADLRSGVVAIESAVPAAIAARGVSGFFHGNDARGVPVLATLRRVGDAPWSIVAKIDVAEVDAPLVAWAWMVSGSVAVLVLLGGVAALLLVSREQNELYRRMYEEARQRQAIADRFHALSRLANDIMFLAEPDGRILDVNDRAVETYGYTLEEFQRMNLRDLRLPEHAFELDQHLRSPQARTGLRFETVHRRKDGTTLPVEVSSRIVEIGDRSLLQAIVRDVTQQRRTGDQILRLNRLLAMRSHISRAIVESRGAAVLLEAVCESALEAGGFRSALVCECDLDERRLTIEAVRGPARPWTQPGAVVPIEGDMLHGPTAMAARTGDVVVANSLDEFPVAALWHQRAVEQGFQAMAAIPIREQGRVRRLLLLFADEVGFFDPALQRLLGELANDLSFALDQMHAERRRRETEERLRAVFSAAPFALFIVERQARRLAAVNPAAGQLYGYTTEQLLSMPAVAIFGPEELRPSPDAEPGRGIPVPLATRHRRQDGSLIDVELYCREIMVEERAAWLVGVVDVTERKHLEEQFRQAHRMEAVGRLAGGVAHDFNNLLTAITGFAGLTLADLSPDSPHRSHLEQIRKAAERAASLTRQLLAFSRRQVLQPQPVDLNATVGDLGRMLQRLIGEHIKLELKLHASHGVVEVDPTQIEQVLLNLCVNARDAMPRGGTLTIETANVHLDGGSSRLGAEIQPGEYVQLVVRDTGLGIAPEIQERIFEPFFTTKPTGQGTGLGLATVHGIVTQSGGHVRVTSERGQGATFIVYLPRIARAEVTVAPSPRPGPLNGRETILLVEDDEGVRHLARSVLERGGYRVVEASDGLRALAVRADSGRPVDLLLTDLVMPGMSGMELARDLDQLQPNVRVLFMSGYPDDALERYGFGARPLHFLQKPFSPDALLLKVRQVLDEPGAPVAG